jgi:PKD domain
MIKRLFQQAFNKAFSHQNNAICLILARLKMRLYMKTTWCLMLWLGLILMTPFTASSQCTECVADLTCVGLDGFPAVCPEVATTAYTNAYYEEFLTFYIPSQVTDPGSGLDATLLSVEVVSVSGLPFGLEFTLNDADGIFYPSQGENYGCGTICGTPLIPGVYDVQIAVDIVAEAFGFEITQSESFIYSITVEPGEGDSGSFTFDNTAGCGSLTVQYEASLAAPFPTVTEYTWDFGNGATSTEMTPAAVPYVSPGTYTCSLTTTISDFKLNDIIIAELSSDWGGDIDDVFSNSDTYFTLTDGQGSTVFTSDAIDNNNTPSWLSLNLLLSNPPYTISFFDEDDISADDNLGNTTLNLNDGSANFTIPNGTMGSFEVLLQETTSVTDSIEINVFDAPVAAFTVNGAQLYFDDPNLTSYQWYINGIAINTENSASIDLVVGGEYACLVGNIYGCSSWSNSYLYCPEISPSYDAIAQEVYVDSEFSSYQWYYNGAPIDGANNYFYSTTTQGNYSVIISTDYGCTTLSEVVIVASDIIENSTRNPQLYPNPCSETTLLSGLRPGDLIRIFDAQGKEVFHSVSTQPSHLINTVAFASGFYSILVGTESNYVTIKLAKL